MATIRELLEPAVVELRAAGSDTPRLDAELLLGHVLGIDRTAVLAHPEAPVGEGQRADFAAALVRRTAGEPVAYIRGVKEFYGIAFAVDRRALIPRPETELLVELGLARLTDAITRASRPREAPPYRVLDVGAGCGAIAVALAVVLRRRGYGDVVRITAGDVSADALQLALENAVGHGVADVIDFRVGDLLAISGTDDVLAELVLANLPYIPSATVPQLPVAASYEPVEALDGGPDGLSLVRRVLDDLPRVLAPEGIALLEIGADQGAAVQAAVARQLPGWRVVLHPDLSGSHRAAEVLPPDRGDSGSGPLAVAAERA